MARNGNAKTRRFALNMLKAGVAIFGAALLFACGDDDSSFGTSAKGGSAAEADIVVTIFDDLPSCVGKREGVTAYVKDEKIAYICTDGDWVADSETGDEGDGDDDDGDDADKKSSSSTSKDEFLNPKITYGTMTDTRDNQVYKTVEICNNETSTCQTWMAENMNYSVNPGKQSWCGGGEDRTKNEGDCSVYGRLYTWAAAFGKSEDECGYGKTCNLPSGDIRGVCPEGWHLPSNVEWNALFTAVGGTSYAGQKLKADSDLWNEGTSNDDSFGFAVLPAGYRDDDGSFYSEGAHALFWSSAEDGSGIADSWCFRWFDGRVDSSWSDENYGYSVRCLQN
ncbi:MAG: fibrobacter succinogenes major paralogous domain-containing protein [Fibrobacter sp.]|nr:fibrobacter succinogenes major paralogous domain-containing protein [Fibrobacter sp.]